MSVFYALAVFRGIDKSNRKKIKDFGKEMFDIYIKNGSRKRGIRWH